MRANDIQSNPKIGHDFTVSILDHSFPVTLPFLGYCNIYNALAAMATGHSLGIPTKELGEGLSNCKLLSQRYEIFQHDSMTIINDAYNANPQSMQEALTTLANFRSPGKKIFVMGDMLELDDLSQSAHTHLGEEIAKQPIDVLVTVGELAGLAVKSARMGGMKENRTLAFESHREASDYLQENTQPGDCLLFKGSRGAGMEKVIEGLVHPNSH